MNENNNWLDDAPGVFGFTSPHSVEKKEHSFLIRTRENKKAFGERGPILSSKINFILPSHQATKGYPGAARAIFSGAMGVRG